MISAFGVDHGEFSKAFNVLGMMKRPKVATGIKPNAGPAFSLENTLSQTMKKPTIPGQPKPTNRVLSNSNARNLGQERTANRQTFQRAKQNRMLNPSREKYSFR